MSVTKRATSKRAALSPTYKTWHEFLNKTMPTLVLCRDVLVNEQIEPRYGVPPSTRAAEPPAADWRDAEPNVSILAIPGDQVIIRAWWFFGPPGAEDSGGHKYNCLASITGWDDLLDLQQLERTMRQSFKVDAGRMLLTMGEYAEE